MVPRMLFYEAASRYLGDAAFENWLEWSRIFFLAGLRGFRLNGVDGFCAWTDELYAHPFNTDRAEGIKDNRKLSWHYFTEPLLGTENHEWMRTNSWYFKLRALAYYPWPEEFGQGNGPVKKSIFAPLYKNEMQPLYLTLTGEKNDLFTRDHNFYGGETVRKQVAVVNDTEEPVTVNGTVALRIGGKTTASFPFRKTVAQGAIDFIPFEFRLPAVNIKTKAELLLEAEGRKESFALTLFPKPDRKALTDAAKKVSIGIAKGKGGSVAGKAGLKGIQVDLAKGVPKGIDVLIVERGALVRNTDAKSLSGFLRNGGRILIFEQDDTSLYSHRVNEQRLEHAAVRVETRGIENRIFRAEIVGDRALQLLMDILRAADETHRRHAVASAVHGPLGRLDQTGMVRKPQIVVGAEIQHGAARDFDLGTLRRGDHPFGLIQSRRLDISEFPLEIFLDFPVHRLKVLRFHWRYLMI